MVCVKSPTFSLMINGCPTIFCNSMRGIRRGDSISSLLFVVYMKYVCSIMLYVGKQPRLSFRPRCKSVTLNHLCFADDVILFCKGHYRSIHLMLQGI